MKNKWHDIIKNRLVENRKECLNCLYPENDYTWGTTRKNLKRTINLLNTLLKDIPVDAWPNLFRLTNASLGEYKIASNNWKIILGWKGNRRTADLVFKRDDHTAWVIERNGKFVNFDIGGS
jgi:hypothetical protein